MGFKQHYFAAICATSLLTAVLFGLGDGTISHPTPYDPVLMGSRGPCDPDLASADVVGGTDVNGNPVASADVAPSEVPPGVQVLARLPNRDYVQVETLKLPPPTHGCPAKPQQSDNVNGR